METLGGSAIPIIVLASSDLEENGGKYRILGGSATPVFVTGSSEGGYLLLSTDAYIGDS